MQKFWDRVRTLLGEPSVVDLSKMLDVKRSTLSSWIHNDRRPPMEVLMTLTSLTGLSLGKLEHGYDWEPPYEEDEAAEHHCPRHKAIMQIVPTLNEEEQELILSILTFIQKSHTTKP